MTRTMTLFASLALATISACSGGDTNLNFERTHGYGDAIGPASSAVRRQDSDLGGWGDWGTDAPGMTIVSYENITAQATVTGAFYGTEADLTDPSRVPPGVSAALTPNPSSSDSTRGSINTRRTYQVNEGRMVVYFDDDPRLDFELIFPEGATFNDGRTDLDRAEIRGASTDIFEEVYDPGTSLSAGEWFQQSRFAIFDREGVYLCDYTECTPSGDGRTFVEFPHLWVQWNSDTPFVGKGYATFNRGVERGFGQARVHVDGRDQGGNSGDRLGGLDVVISGQE